MIADEIFNNSTCYSKKLLGEMYFIYSDVSAYDQEKRWLSLVSDLAMGWTTKELWFYFRQRQEIYLFSKNVQTH
jgi:hypothetical protein